MTEKKTLIDFPCQFPLKIMGLNETVFIEEIVLILQQFDKTLKAQNVATKLSSNGKYLSLSLSVYTTDQQHLDDIYRAVTAHPLAKFVL